MTSLLFRLFARRAIGADDLSQILIEQLELVDQIGKIVGRALRRFRFNVSGCRLDRQLLGRAVKRRVGDDGLRSDDRLHFFSNILNNLSNVGAIASELIRSRILEDVLHDLGNVLLLEIVVKAIQAFTYGLVFEL